MIAHPIYHGDGDSLQSSVSKFSEVSAYNSQREIVRPSAEAIDCSTVLTGWIMPSDSISPVIPEARQGQFKSALRCHHDSANRSESSTQ